MFRGLLTTAAGSSTVVFWTHRLIPSKLCCAACSSCDALV